VKSSPIPNACCADMRDLPVSRLAACGGIGYVGLVILGTPESSHFWSKTFIPEVLNEYSDTK
jgi:hypothetical protein